MANEGGRALRAMDSQFPRGALFSAGANQAPVISLCSRPSAKSGRTKRWIKVKKPNSPAMLRIHEGTCDALDELFSEPDARWMDGRTKLVLQGSKQRRRNLNRRLETLAKIGRPRPCQGLALRSRAHNGNLSRNVRGRLYDWICSALVHLATSPFQEASVAKGNLRGRLWSSRRRAK